MPEKYVGKVVWFDAKLGYGFIESRSDDEEDLFVHWSDIAIEGFKTLKKGAQVAYSIGENKRNQPKAVDVVVIEQEEGDDTSPPED